MKAMQSIVALAMIIIAPLCRANDFPTADRVEFVLECMRDHTGGQFELLNKCSCTIDHLAGQYKYDDFVEAQTMAKAVTIAGERGSILRDNEDAQKAARRYRASVVEASRSCFLR
jgi:hypothetical protein